MGNIMSVLPGIKNFRNRGMLEMGSYVDFNIPEDLIIEILSFVPAKDLIKNCRLVCHQWDDIISSNVIWRQKCQREKKLIPSYKLKSIPPNYFRNIYFYDPYGKNLVNNPYGEAKLKDWTIMTNGGEGWVVEDPPKGADPVPEAVGSQSCFATSYGECKKYQVIDLVKRGINKEILDEVMPDIIVGEWHSSRFDCGGVYNLIIVLLNEETEEVDSYLFGPYRQDQWTGRIWVKTEHVFSDYGPGVRHILFQHVGSDTQFWAGHYGSKMTGGYIKISTK